MSTETERIVYSREECIEAAAQALARCWADLGEEATTAPAEARAAV